MEENSTTPLAPGVTIPATNGEPTTIVDTTATTIEAQKAEILVLQQKLHDETRRLDYWKQRFARAETDWNILRDRLTEEANDRDWCAEYDTIINELNGCFTVFELLKRVKSYDVNVTLTATYYTTVSVEASSEDDAREQVDNMDTDDISNNSGMSWHCPDEGEVTINEVEVV
jgi:hypothetical protein